MLIKSKLKIIFISLALATVFIGSIAIYAYIQLLVTSTRAEYTMGEIIELNTMHRDTCQLIKDAGDLLIHDTTSHETIKESLANLSYIFEERRATIAVEYNEIAKDDDDTEELVLHTHLQTACIRVQKTIEEFLILVAEKQHDAARRFLSDEIQGNAMKAFTAALTAATEYEYSHIHMLKANSERAFLFLFGLTVTLSILLIGTVFVAYKNLAYSVTQPIDNLKEAAKKIGSGHLDIDITHYNDDEIGELANHFDVMARSLMFFRKKLSEEREKAIDLAKTVEVGKLKKQFLANTSHELRTPLTGIIAFAEAITESNSMAEMKEKAEIVLKESHVLLRLLNDILDQSKLESGKLLLETYPFSLHDMLHALENSTRALASQKDLSFSAHYGDDLPLFIHSDETRIHQILMNLLNNATKFTESGSVTFSVYAAEISTRKATLIFTIADTGIGIPEERIRDIFSPFIQADTSTTRTFGGTGLGTTIAKELTELIGGTIAVESTLGKGSTFTVTLPLLLAPEHVGKECITTNATSPTHPSHIRILIAEDYETNIEIVKMYMQKLPHAYDVATDGKAAVAYAQKNHYDLILMDLHMPIMDGFEATKEIREMPGYKQTPIIALTANADAETKNVCLKIGMNAVLSKPFRRKLFFEMLAQHLPK